MLVLLFGGVEAGRAYWTNQAIKDVATSVARCVGVARPECAPGGTYNDAKTLSYAMDAAKNLGVSLAPGSVRVVANGECAGVGGFVVVTVTHRFTSPVEIVFSNAIVMTGDACYPVTSS